MFTRKTIRFLRDIEKNNNRDWFNDNKERYESDVRQPALAFIESMATTVHAISPHFDVTAKKVGGSLMRIHRDTRFSKDKTPYKTNIGIHFRHARGKDVHTPGFYLHIEPGMVFIGAGIWKPDNSTLSAIRLLIDDHPKEWQGMKRRLLSKHDVVFGGDSLKRPPKGFDKEHPLLEDIKRKDFIVTCELPPSSAYADDFRKQVSLRMKHAAPLVGFICEANDLMF